MRGAINLQTLGSNAYCSVSVTVRFKWGSQLLNEIARELRFHFLELLVHPLKVSRVLYQRQLRYSPHIDACYGRLGNRASISLVL